MDFKYRVQGKVRAGFILRGLYCPFGTDIDLSIYENELAFLRDKCSNLKVIEIKEQVEKVPEPVLKVSEVEPKGEENGEHSCRTNKTKNKGQVSKSNNKRC